MAILNKIPDNFPEEIIRNTLKGKIVSGNIYWKNEPILLQAEKMEFNQILFSIDNTKDSLRVEFSKKPFKDLDIERLFWLSDFKDNNVEIKFLPCGNMESAVRPGESLEIGFGDNIPALYNYIKIDKIPEKLSKDFVFRSDNLDFVFYETFTGKTKNLRIHGPNKRMDIIIEDNKWLVNKIINKPFTKKHDDFLQLNVLQSSTVEFIESSKAKAAYIQIQNKEVEGSTLIKLWEIYSQIELQRAEQLKEKIGNLSFIKLRNSSEGISEVRINNLTTDLKSLINHYKDDLLNSSLELIIEKKDQQKSVKDESNKFELHSINSIFSFRLHDELDIIPNKGEFTISIIGNQAVQRRREVARKSLHEDSKFITRNLLFAIEGSAEAMLSKKRKEKGVTDRTREFLKKHFNIDKLTQNQGQAIEIAINTPDVAIIQGPPGTGKSTVVAAIADRLIEIAEKKERNFSDKLILVSAFQNDTVEHIASKIFTLGLPTIKLGKVTQSNIRPEDKLIEDMTDRIDNSLQKLISKTSDIRLSQKFIDIKEIYKNEKDDEKFKEEVADLIISADMSEELRDEWEEIDKYNKDDEKFSKKNLDIIKGIRTGLEAYNDDGFSKVIRLLKSKLPLSDDEISFLNKCPIDNPDNAILERLAQIQENHLELSNQFANKIKSGNDLMLLDWLERLIIDLKQKEAIFYEDEDTFLTANLEALREELEGSKEYVRETIKDYAQSLAATNQISGGREMSEYSGIENVILEEAARSNPLDLLIPMAQARERIIMVGDQNQLPHLLENDIADETSEKVYENLKDANIHDNTEATPEEVSKKLKIIESRKKLEESLFGIIFNNLLKAKPQRVITLTEQFRMHPCIGDFISKVYYQNQLIAGNPNQADFKRHELEIPWAKDKVAIFCNVGHSKGAEKSGKSKSRPAEAEHIFELLDELKADPNFENLSVGIITFYARQVTELFKEAQRKGYTEKDSYEILKEYEKTPDGREKLRIGSVDSFQGKEFDIVILSTVRSNEYLRTDENARKIFGFLTLENRLNVAFSRAQKLLIVVGNGKMFSDELSKTNVEGLYEFYTNLSKDEEYGQQI